MSQHPSGFFSPQATPHSNRTSRRIPSTSLARSDPDGHAELDRYFTWLVKKYPADNEILMAAKDKLHAKGLDLVTIRKTEHKVLDDWGIIWGIADKVKREIKNFQEWELHQELH